MPIYEYECVKCKRVLEIMHKMTDNPKIKCTRCLAVMKRLISKIGGFTFKGSGFFRNDYPRNKLMRRA